MPRNLRGEPARFVTPDIPGERQNTLAQFAGLANQAAQSFPAAKVLRFFATPRPQNRGILVAVNLVVQLGEAGN
jgi:hypothetical protein